jgi:translation initiation factor IF-3
VNERIREAEIRVIGSEGEQLGVMSSDDALARAVDEGLDLVEVAPGSRPPVCRIMDYGRYKYEQKKKQGKAKGHAASLKEIKMRPRTDDHDLETKLKKARTFLMDGDKVKVTVMYRGREMVHRNLGRVQLDRVVGMLGNLATIENPPRMEGRFLSMILVPNREGVSEAKRKEATELAETVEAGTAEAVVTGEAEKVVVLETDKPTAGETEEATAEETEEAQVKAARPAKADKAPADESQKAEA